MFAYRTPPLYNFVGRLLLEGHVFTCDVTIFINFLLWEANRKRGRDFGSYFLNPCRFGKYCVLMGDDYTRVRFYYLFSVYLDLTRYECDRRWSSGEAIGYYAACRGFDSRMEQIFVVHR